MKPGRGIMRSVKAKRVLAWLVFAIFVSGFLFQSIGMWTIPILSAWLVGTQRPLRSLAVLIVFGILFALPTFFGLAKSGHLFPEAGRLLGRIALSAAPYFLYRLAKPGIPAMASIMLLAVLGGAFACIPGVFPGSSELPHHLTAGPPTFRSAGLFALCYGALVTSCWNAFGRYRIRMLAAAPLLIHRMCFATSTSESSAWLPLGVITLALALGWSLFNASREQRPRITKQTLADLRSPSTGHPCQIAPRAFSKPPMEKRLQSAMACPTFAWQQI